ncbi:MAG: PD40 domain-containing protein, partial [Victivallales bacterium]|nr:PD40 domain-containing protein [Victivallales bacterium]
LSHDGQIHSVTTPEGHAIHPAWAPNGSLIFAAINPNQTSAQAIESHSHDGCNLYLLSKEGITTRLTTGHWRDFTPTVAPDGHTLWFATSRNRAKIGDGSHLATLDLQNITAPVTEFAFTSGGNFDAIASPTISNDGKYICWAQLKGTYGNWRLIVARTSDLTQNAPLSDTNMSCYSPKWSPDGQFIACTGYKNGDLGWGIYIFEPRAKRFTRIDTGSGNSKNPVWTSDGKAIVFENNSSGLYKLYQIELTKLVPNPLPPQQHNDAKPRLAQRLDLTNPQFPAIVNADGERIAATTVKDGSYAFNKPPRLDFGDETFYFKVTFIIREFTKESQVICGTIYPGFYLSWQLHVTQDQKLAFASRSPAKQYLGLFSINKLELNHEYHVVAVHETDGTMRMSIDGQPPLVTQQTKSVTLGQAEKLVFGGDGNTFRLHGTVSAFECGLGYPDNMPRALHLDEIFSE